ncbi:hypothetical protein GGR56DRAFT_622610 [Xylariaceae sp. FL0804]|nr:hypothetical protein GGR56DRAFT_622610 [Xylariaceae sp. FL0804]
MFSLPVSLPSSLFLLLSMRPTASSGDKRVMPVQQPTRKRTRVAAIYLNRTCLFLDSFVHVLGFGITCSPISDCHHCRTCASMANWCLSNPRRSMTGIKGCRCQLGSAALRMALCAMEAYTRRAGSRGVDESCIEKLSISPKFPIAVP